MLYRISTSREKPLEGPKLRIVGVAQMLQQQLAVFRGNDIGTGATNEIVQRVGVARDSNLLGNEVLHGAHMRREQWMFRQLPRKSVVAGNYLRLETNGKGQVRCIVHCDSCPDR